MSGNETFQVGDQVLVRVLGHGEVWARGEVTKLRDAAGSIFDVRLVDGTVHRGLFDGHVKHMDAVSLLGELA